MPFSNFLVDKLIDHLLRNTTYTSPANVWIGLHTASPTDAGGVGEVSGGAYARMKIGTGGVTTFIAGVGTKVTENAGAINFPVATADWGTITHLSVSDAVSAGNLLLHGILDASKLIETDDQATFNAGKLDISWV